MVIVVGSVIAATLAVFFRPAIEGWFALRVRTDLSDQAATALRTMQRDVRIAVPNSIRTPAPQCFELVPTSAGGRFRRAADTANDSAQGCATTPGANCSAPLDVTAPVSSFDVLSALAAAPAANDWVVIDNQNPGDVYAGANTGRVASVAATPGAPAGTLGQHRITLAAATQFPNGYDGGRFVVVPDSQKAVFYVCSGAGVDSAGNGTGSLLRYANYGFNSAYPAACRSGGGGAVLATNVKTCRFVYDPNQGATQQSGFVSMQLELSRNSEVVSLLMGVHVVNVP